MNVGDYVRTKYGIAKYISDKVTRATIYKVIDKNIVYDNVEGWEDVLLDNEIIKSSPNIIDLIEVGDYVNGMEVTRIAGTYYGRKDKAIYCEHNGNENWKQVMIYDDEIKSIVTKEQFKSIKYEVN